MLNLFLCPLCCIFPFIVIFCRFPISLTFMTPVQTDSLRSNRTRPGTVFTVYIDRFCTTIILSHTLSCLYTTDRFSIIYQTYLVFRQIPQKSPVPSPDPNLTVPGPYQKWRIPVQRVRSAIQKPPFCHHGVTYRGTDRELFIIYKGFYIYCLSLERGSFLGYLVEYSMREHPSR